MSWMWSDKAAPRYPPGRTIVPRPMLIVLSGVTRLHVDGIALTNSPSFHLAPQSGTSLLRMCASWLRTVKISV